MSHLMSQRVSMLIANKEKNIIIHTSRSYFYYGYAAACSNISHSEIFMRLGCDLHIKFNPDTEPLGATKRTLSQTVTQLSHI